MEQNLLGLIRERQTETEREQDDWARGALSVLCVNYNLLSLAACGAQRETAEDRLSTKKKNTAFCSFILAFAFADAEQLQSTKDKRYLLHCRDEPTPSNQVNIY